MLELLFDLVGDTLLSSEYAMNEYRAKLAAENARVEKAKIKSAIAEGKWICECGHINIKHAAECSSCGKWKSSCQANVAAKLEALEEIIAQNGGSATSAEPFKTTQLVLTADGKWICGCGYKNRKNADECSACGNRKPSPQENKTAVQEAREAITAQPVEPVKPVENNAAAPAEVSAKGIWFCGKCGSLNENTDSCKTCGNKKE